MIEKTQNSPPTQNYNGQSSPTLKREREESLPAPGREKARKRKTPPCYLDITANIPSNIPSNGAPSSIEDYSARLENHDCIDITASQSDNLQPPAEGCQTPPKTFIDHFRTIVRRMSRSGSMGSEFSYARISSPSRCSSPAAVPPRTPTSAKVENLFRTPSRIIEVKDQTEEDSPIQLKKSKDPKDLSNFIKSFNESYSPDQ